MINTAFQTPDAKKEKLITIGGNKYRLVVKFKDKVAKEIATILLNLSNVEKKNLTDQSELTPIQDAASIIFRELKTNAKVIGVSHHDDWQKAVIDKVLEKSWKEKFIVSDNVKEIWVAIHPKELSNIHFSAKISKEDIFGVFNLEISTEKENEELIRKFLRKIKN